jgi:hypothetical protein
VKNSTRLLDVLAEKVKAASKLHHVSVEKERMPSMLHMPVSRAQLLHSAPLALLVKGVMS